MQSLGAKGTGSLSPSPQGISTKRRAAVMEDASETEDLQEVEQALGASGATATPPYTQDADTVMNDATLPPPHSGSSVNDTITETPSNSPRPMPATPTVSEELHADATIPLREPLDTATNDPLSGTGSSAGKGNAQDATLENPAVPVTEETMNPHSSEPSGMNVDSIELPNAASPGLGSYRFQSKWPNVPYKYKPQINAVSV